MTKIDEAPKEVNSKNYDHTTQIVVDLIHSYAKVDEDQKPNKCGSKSKTSLHKYWKLEVSKTA